MYSLQLEATYRSIKVMLILIHVIIALLSIGIASFVYLKPSIKRLAVSYLFIVGTVGTGTALLLSTPGNILKSCLVGLLYLTVVSIVTIATHVRIQRLAEAHVTNE